MNVSRNKKNYNAIIITQNLCWRKLYLEQSPELSKLILPCAEQWSKIFFYWRHYFSRIASAFSVCICIVLVQTQFGVSIKESIIQHNGLSALSSLKQSLKKTVVNSQSSCSFKGRSIMIRVSWLLLEKRVNRCEDLGPTRWFSKR